MSSYGFPAARRLLRAAAFRAVLDDRCGSKDKLFVVYAKANGLARGRLGITVSKKTSPKAVRRNLIKRLVRESFRHHAADVSGLDIVAIARQPCASAANKDICQSLDRHWHQVNSQCRKS
ncbi:MAG TPA: ribonuclease P protein component [Gammaproteobacteria bacterium]|nr:ribonuclease P protein component [Acidiferrobacteraceae bacterium]HCX86428.1 ribonuclease P protein component [Gammaproteobacteria bacterium]